MRERPMAHNVSTVPMIAGRVTAGKVARQDRGGADSDRHFPEVEQGMA
jgi:hypothetical protein